MPVAFVNPLQMYMGKNISEICLNGYTDTTFNHCAHFVSHVMQFKFGYQCNIAGGKPNSAGYCVRVHELFSRCPQVGKFDDRKDLHSCLVFVTLPANVNLTAKTMDNVPRKHVGIYFNGLIYHYSNSQDKVISQTPEQFINHYPNQKNGLFYGSFPPGN